MAQTILAPVGTSTATTRAVNSPADVRTIQSLLNEIPPEQGGPTPKLAVDGIVGPKTIGAIRTFQKKQFGWQDGLVEPGQVTLRRLNELTDDEFRLCGRKEVPSVSPFVVPRL